MNNSRIRDLRKSLKLTQKDFAEKLGMTQAAITFLEQGQTKLTDKQIKPICSIFGASEQWLKTGEGDMFTNNATLALIEETAQKLNEDNQKYALALIKAMLEEQDDPNLEGT